MSEFMDRLPISARIRLARRAHGITPEAQEERTKKLERMREMGRLEDLRKPTLIERLVHIFRKPT